MTAVQTKRAPVGDAPPAAPVTGLRHRRSAPHMLLGAVLVVVCALAFAVTGLRMDSRTAVLALAQPVPAGHVLSEADLTVVSIVADPALGAVPQSQRSTVLGRTVRLPLAAHALLGQDMLGPPAWPPAGQSLVAVSVKSGHAPTGAAAGVQVLVLVVPPSASANNATTGGVVRAAAEVVSVSPADSAGTTVVSLLVTSANAVKIAGTVGDVSLVVQGGVG